MYYSYGKVNRGHACFVRCIEAVRILESSSIINRKFFPLPIVNWVHVATCFLIY